MLFIKSIRKINIYLKKWRGLHFIKKIIYANVLKLEGILVSMLKLKEG